MYPNLLIYQAQVSISSITILYLTTLRGAINVGALGLVTRLRLRKRSFL